VYLLPGAVHAPSPEVVVGGLPRHGEVVREQAPSTPAPEHVEDGVQELSGLVCSGTSAGFCLGDQGLEDLPFIVGEIGRIGSSGAHEIEAPSRYGSRILLLQTASQTPSELDFSHLGAWQSASAKGSIYAPKTFCGSVCASNTQKVSHLERDRKRLLGATGGEAEDTVPNSRDQDQKIGLEASERGHFGTLRASLPRSEQSRA